MDFRTLRNLICRSSNYSYIAILKENKLISSVTPPKFIVYPPLLPLKIENSIISENDFIVLKSTGVCLGGKLSPFSDISQNSLLEKQTLHKIQCQKKELFTKFNIQA